MDLRAGLTIRGERREFFGDLIERLLWFAEAEFRLSKPQKGGGTLRDHFDAYRRMARRAHPDEPSSCPLPETLQYIWVYFWDLNAGRPVWQGGYRPIPATEFQAWQDINEIRLTRWELSALRRLDALFLKIAVEE